MQHKLFPPWFPVLGHFDRLTNNQWIVSATLLIRSSALKPIVLNALKALCWMLWKETQTNEKVSATQQRAFMTAVCWSFKNFGSQSIRFNIWKGTQMIFHPLSFDTCTRRMDKPSPFSPWNKAGVFLENVQRLNRGCRFLVSHNTRWGHSYFSGLVFHTASWDSIHQDLPRVDWVKVFVYSEQRR